MLLKLHVPLNLLSSWVLVSWWSWDGRDGHMTLKAGTASCVFFFQNQCPSMSWWPDGQMTLNKAGTASCVFLPQGKEHSSSSRTNVHQCPDGLMDRWHSKLEQLLVSSSLKVREHSVGTLPSLCLVPSGKEHSVGMLPSLCLVPQDKEHSVEMLPSWCLVPLG